MRSCNRGYDFGCDDCFDFLSVAEIQVGVDVGEVDVWRLASASMLTSILT